jgi:hypothetical protein
MSYRTHYILTAGFWILWLAGVVWLVGPAKLMAAISSGGEAIMAVIPSPAETRTFIDRTMSLSWAHHPDHFVRLHCTGTLRTAVKSEPWEYSPLINTDKKLLTINDYPPVQLVGDDILTVTGAGDGVNTIILNRGTHALMIGFQEEGGAKTGLFNGTCKRVDPLF